jgi:hypothetical protein
VSGELTEAEQAAVLTHLPNAFRFDGKMGAISTSSMVTPEGLLITLAPGDYEPENMPANTLAILFGAPFHARAFLDALNTVVNDSIRNNEEIDDGN